LSTFGKIDREIDENLCRTELTAAQRTAYKIVNASLDSGVELDALARLPEPERAALVERAADGAGTKFGKNHVLMATQWLHRPGIKKAC
jgi:hypothetical protein